MTGTIASIQNRAVQRRITRLCHLTPSRNLGHIAVDPRGILALQHLEKDEKSVFNPTDLARLDGYLDHVCCSIQYPNAWYFRKARNKEQLFPDWGRTADQSSLPVASQYEILSSQCGSYAWKVGQ